MSTRSKAPATPTKGKQLSLLSFVSAKGTPTAKTTPSKPSAAKKQTKRKAQDTDDDDDFVVSDDHSDTAPQQQKQSKPAARGRATRSAAPKKNDALTRPAKRAKVAVIEDDDDDDHHDSENNQNNPSKGNAKIGGNGDRTDDECDDSAAKKTITLADSDDIDGDMDVDTAATAPTSQKQQDRNATTPMIATTCVVGGKGALAGVPLVRDAKRHQKFAKKLAQQFAVDETTENNGGYEWNSVADLERAFVDCPRVGAKTKTKYTPLEQQFVDVKRQHKDLLLAVEVGYKFKFYGEDAEIAAQELNICCYRDKNFASASIPTQRIYIHIKKLVDAGHKVGVVRQTETAALKAAGDNKSGLFTRGLTEVYSRATLVGNMFDSDSAETLKSDVPTDGFLMCVFDTQDQATKGHTIAILAVNFNSGHVIHDTFVDDARRSHLETRLTQLQPLEIIAPTNISAATQKMLKHPNCITQGECARLELTASKNFELHTAQTLAKRMLLSKSDSTEDATAEDAIPRVSFDAIMHLPDELVCCFGGLLAYLSDFNITHILKVSSQLHPFSEKTRMVVDAATTNNLAILRGDNMSTHGSLLWLLDHTHTAFGSRLMKRWITQPLVSRTAITKRLDAVEEIVNAQTRGAKWITDLQNLMRKLPDLEKVMTQASSAATSPQHLNALLEALQNTGTVLATMTDAINTNDIQSPLLCELVNGCVDLSVLVGRFTKMINCAVAKTLNSATNLHPALFLSLADFPLVAEAQAAISDIEQQLDQHLIQVRKQLRMPNLNYKSVQLDEYMIELAHSVPVPNDWFKIGSTKAVSRYHSPVISGLYKLLCQGRETLAARMQTAWTQILKEFSAEGADVWVVIRALAALDCLVSFAHVAVFEGYCKPTISETHKLEIQDGRHPLVEALMDGAFVPNTVNMSCDGTRCLCITGPNMGGKSSFSRMIALIVMMAQIGSYVPASRVEMGVFDGIFTRMGARDHLASAMSTFLVELSEASEIIRLATSKSLIIFDELGRGTSTHDGVAIAFSTLKHVLEKIQSFCLFITHYPQIAQLQNDHRELSAVHMAYLETKSPSPDQPPIVTFLYKVQAGLANRSYGLNVARLAGIGKDVLSLAHKQSLRFEVSCALPQALHDRKLPTHKRKPHEQDAATLDNDNNNNADGTVVVGEQTAVDLLVAVKQVLEAVGEDGEKEEVCGVAARLAGLSELLVGNTKSG